MLNVYSYVVSYVVTFFNWQTNLKSMFSALSVKLC
jgi:hypothetical protein